ncbi:hypothetical protein FXB39_15170 [Nocardioides sp. BGMRC 2183]|nr:hypothetical protein FXB39_15170 [Nocardioides sp. BGMRC 2183]
MNDVPSVVDLDAADLEWGEHQIAGADQPARMVMLRMDAEAGVRTVLVQFPDGWRRDATGHQPAAEEMVLLSGALSISGLEVSTEHLLVMEPRATRSATSVRGETSAVVWFSGPGGGWAEGEAPDGGEGRLLDLGPSLARDPRAGLAGSVEASEAVGGAVFATDVEVLWPAARRWAFVPAGSSVPDVAGLAVVHT